MKAFSIITSIILSITILGFHSIPGKAQPADWLALTDTDGQRHNRTEVQNGRAAIFFFVAVECPISNRYAPEINRIVAEYTTKNYHFYAVQSDPDVTANTARAHAQDYGYKFPVLLDPSQRLAKRFGVALTPTVIVVSPAGEMIYRGRIDNRYLDFGRYRDAGIKRDLRLVLDAISAKKPVAEPVTNVIGCALPPPGKDR